MLPTMPVLFHENKNNWKRLLYTIIKSRQDHNSSCVLTHDQDDLCCFSDNITEGEIIINILQRNTNCLIERWIIHFHAHQDDIQGLLDTISHFMHSNPLSIHHVYTMIHYKNQLCSNSHFDQHKIMEFRKLARLKAHHFNCNSISIQLVLDETLIIMQHHQPPIIAVRRLSRLSLSAIDQINHTHPMTTSIPIPSTHTMQYTTHHHSTVAYSTSPIHTKPSYLSVPSSQRRSSLDHGLSLVGSFEESLFSGRMSSQPSKPITFHCQLGVLGYDCKPSLKCPPHWSILFPATFYDFQDDHSTPYVGTVDIQDHLQSKNLSMPGYRIPPKGQIQVVVKNPNKTAVKLFLIPYDFTDMPRNSKTFLRQKSYGEQPGHHDVLRYAIHLHVCRTEKKRIYIYKHIRIVFANRIADAREKFKVICEGPKEPVYVPL
ncbi:hypothetical protein RMCBS344292_14782 [Rhizopus microsporus]|nr:hypothetical protein RMCBS344292_14782 [Rhizopus microsporus]